MSRKKQIRFAALHEMANVVDGRRSVPGWFDAVVGSREAVVLELGCGRGEYTLALARGRPRSHVIGVDRNGSRLWKGAQRALEEGVSNAFFLRSMVEELEDHVPSGRVSEIWLPFPDPLPKKRQAKHRLTSPRFLERYRRLLRSGGTVYLRTDDADLVRFAELSVRGVGGQALDGESAMREAAAPLMSVQTTYEKKFREEGRPIYDRAFRLDVD